MKNTPLNLLLTAILMLTLSVSHSLPNSEMDNFHYNPLLLNGKSMDITRVTVASNGKLSMFEGDHPVAGAPGVPFFAYLTRDGKMVETGSHVNDRIVREVELSSILKFAKAGDRLYIDPALTGAKVGRRIIMVKGNPALPGIKWFYWVDKGKEGC